MNELKHNKLANTLSKVNRELSWIAFNERVLLEAMDTDVPVLERLRFLGIFSNNLDEFFRVRVGTLNRLLGKRAEDKLSYNPKLILEQIYLKLKEDEKIFNKAFIDIKREMKKNGIQFISNNQVKNENLKWCREYFKRDVLRGISPLIFNDEINFPILKDKSIYLAVKIILKSDEIKYSLIEVPTEFFPRFIEIPNPNPNIHQVILLDDLIRINLDEIYKVFEIHEASAYTIKLTRDAELNNDNDVSKINTKLLTKSLKQRHKGIPVRFIADKSIPKDLLNFLTSKNKISKQNIVLGGKYHNFKDFINFPDFGLGHLKYPKLATIPHLEIENARSILKTIEKKDVLLFYPYHSFTYLLDFLREASIDPNVVEIKMSLYRLSKKSQIVNILSNAAKNGKKITVVMEITARFDEENNIRWANQMEEEGIHVIFGHPKYKVHTKLVYVLKKNNLQIKEYCNISTGNFNEVTADVYSDIALFTTDKRLTKEVKQVFTYLETHKIPSQISHLMMAPFNFREKLLSLIEQEIKIKKKTGVGHIIIKVNSLVDDEIIDKLYKAKSLGVHVDIIARGICCVSNEVKPNKQIKAISIIDKFLEHARVFYFQNNTKPICYISSADIMVRNIDFRVEVAAPIFNSEKIVKIKKFLDIQLSDNTKSRIHNADLTNEKILVKRPNSKKIRAQVDFYNILNSEKYS